ncbi:MAG TPA: hypothetical protein PLL36_11960 [Candidatus Hydrogenedentes bacterium]|nr:MAG: hypothetical protein BWY09_02124 [Candidatus Hydrogenedentes bacterium ADurb.Bin179]HOC70922.1 hypothetical protein [Candidatus Hydrogenedentota bacterium]HQN01788.1 hypothetical protein [Candidatus Hydrogenedentota bacterium]
MPSPYTVQQLSKIASDFVVKKRGNWNHEEWEQFCAEVSKFGITLDTEMQARLGLLLETLKVFYVSIPKRVKTVSAKRKTGAKRKPKAKTKAAAAPEKQAGDLS